MKNLAALVNENDFVAIKSPINNLTFVKYFDKTGDRYITIDPESFMTMMVDEFDPVNIICNDTRVLDLIIYEAQMRHIMITKVSLTSDNNVILVALGGNTNGRNKNRKPIE